MILAVLSAAQFLLALDFSIVYVALPAIARDLGLSLAAAQWVVSAYAVPFAGFLLLGGRLSDRWGAGRLFLAATLLFGLASLAGGLASSGPALLAARAVQGLAAALLQPAILGLIGARFTGAARTRALSVWGAVGASGLAAGVVLGGALTRLSWRWTFLVNVPVVAACAAGAGAWLWSTARTRGTPAPLTRTLLSTAAAVLLALGLTEGGARGWRSWPTLLALTGSLVFFAFITIFRTSRFPRRGRLEGFRRREAAAGGAPLVGFAVALIGGHMVTEYDRERGISYWTKNYRTSIEDDETQLAGYASGPADQASSPASHSPRSLRTGSWSAALYMASVGSEFYVVTLMLQNRDGYTPLQAGLAFLPLAALVTAGSSATARLIRRFGTAPTLAGAFTAAAASLAWLALTANTGYFQGVLPGLLVSGAAHGVIYTSMFVLGAREVPPAQQSSAGATMTTAQYLTGAVTVALLTLPLHSGAYATAFWLTTTAAAAGALVALSQARHDRAIKPPNSDSDSDPAAPALADHTA
ncbi:MFS transporter [Dactylosporangium sp. McL0621]|uniref:MFS transporter n=1 Tax=Dactylosporangium sp. McL0621 TaxID=3415678 RepID=UPI003CF06B9B